VIGEAGDADSLFKLLAHTTPDVVLLDITLPGKSGIEIARKIRVDFPEIKILLLSADGCKKNILDAINAHAAGFILKNSGKKTLIQAIKAVNHGEKFYDQSISQILINDLILKINPDNEYPDRCTEREIEILKLMAGGLSHKQVAAQLFISKRTVDSHVNNLMKKLKLHTMAELVRYAIRNNIAQA